MKLFLVLALLLSIYSTAAQETDTVFTAPLQNILIRAFEQNKKLKEIPAAINFVGAQQLQSFGSLSVVQAVNTTPGVRMEERSPGSYRFSIRGSSLRSPFGVRNVKVYYNDLPVTDPGGQTYLNGFGFHNFNSIEIVKGPGSSLYGAGTGGVLLIESMNNNAIPGLTVEYTAGSYGTHAVYAEAVTGDDVIKNKINYEHQQSDGYRIHSALDKTVLSWTGRYKLNNRDELKTTFYYSRHFYETPGALTRAEYDANSKAARPAGGGFPGAEQSRAAITQKSFLAGISYTHLFSTNVSNNTAVYGMFTELRNPAIRNYGKNAEPHAGARTVFTLKIPLEEGQLKMSGGGEFQQGFSTITSYKNKAGEPDTLQTESESPIRQSLVFLQAVYERKGWELLASGSLNYMNLQLRQSFPAPLQLPQKTFSNQLAPRVALSKSWKAVTVYSSLSKGFSPPSSAELVPSGSAINLNLNAEEGINYDLGFRGMLKDLSFDINAFLFSLSNTIVQRRDAGGGDYYTNAGNTSQRGIETNLHYPLLKKCSFIRGADFYVSHTYHHFNYKEFKQLVNDYSGNQIPGIPVQTIAAGFDFSTVNGILFSANYYFSDRIALNDGNTDYANAYHLVSAKIGFDKLIKRWQSKISVGADNLLNQKYSLGNDINAFGGRYYNAAAGRFYYASLSVSFHYKKAKA